MAHQLFLHIGTHKTATTTVQHFLAANRSSLSVQGLVYPDLSHHGFKGPRAHHRLAHATAGRPGTGTPDRARRFFDELRAGLRPDDRVIVSSEAFYRHVLPSTDGSGREYDAGGGAVGDPLPYIQALRDCIGDFDVKVLVMLRRQDRFLESLYAEQVMRSNFVGDIDRFTEERLWLADYEARLSQWAEVFGTDALDVRVFDPASWQQSVEEYFLDWVGGRWQATLEPAATRNVTLPRALVEYKRALNGGLSRPQSAQHRRWLEDLAVSLPPGTLPELGSHYFTHEARRDLLDAFARGNRRVARTYLGRDELFGLGGLAEAYDPPPRLRPRHFRRITRHLLRSLA